MNKVRSTDENVGAAYAERDENLLEWLYQLRDRQRQDQRQGAWLIKGRDLPWENNRQGKMKWFLHPALNHTAIRSMIVFEQEIPPGGKSGAQKTPGDRFCISWKVKATPCSTANATTGKPKIWSISRSAPKASSSSMSMRTRAIRSASSRRISTW